MINQEKEKKSITLERLAEKVDSGFAKVDRQFEEMARIVKVGFDNTATKKDIEAFSSRFDTLEQKVDKVDERLQTVETKLDRALYTEVVHLETRPRRVEEKVGIKPQAVS